MKNEITIRNNPVIKKDISKIQIPDLWQIAICCGSGEDFSKYTDSKRLATQEAILECWHLAHSLKKHITKGN